MLNDVRPPPDPDREFPNNPAEPALHPLPGTHGAHAHIDVKEPGLHHARIMGEPTHINPEYAMPMEDRSSNFSLGLTVAVFIIVVFVLMSIFWTFYR